MVHRGFFKYRKYDCGITKEKQDVVWTKECMESFLKIIGLLTTMLILKVLDLVRYFLVCTGVSKEGFGRVLMQDGQVITYISRKLRRHEYNYATHDWELFSIMYS